jgi:DNA-directed RNA polymerase specialized sigma24 family protein
MTSQPADQDEDGDRDAALLRQLQLARGRHDGALRESVLLAQLIARQEVHIRQLVRWRAHSQQPSAADIDEMLQGVRIGIARDIEKILAGGVTLGAVIGRKVADEAAEFARRRARRAPEVAPGAALDTMSYQDGLSLEHEAAELRERLAALPERDRIFLSERFFGGLRPDELAARHGVHRRVVDTATSRALRKLLSSDALADQRAVRNPGSSSGDGS